MLYFYRNRKRFSDWQAVVIYPSRSVEQSDVYAHRSLLNGEQVHRIYLDSLGEIRQLPLGVALMVLTTLSEAQAPEEARHLLARGQTEAIDPEMSRGMMEMIITVMVYKFTHLSRVEVERMLGISLQETRVYQEARAEEAQSLILRLLHRRVGELPEAIRLQVVALSLSHLEALGEALLDFTELKDLETWLNQETSRIGKE